MEVKVSAPRPLPVIVLVDVSGSMLQDAKITTLNTALNDMARALAAETDIRGEIQLALIAFGDTQARLVAGPTPVREITVRPFSAAGDTPMGKAFAVARDLLADKDVVPVRAFAPTLVLVSDGQPTDEWKPPLAALLGSERGAKAQRFSLAIGIDANRDVLREFAGSEERLVEAADARQITRFFRWVTMSVALRSRAVNPNAPALPLYPMTDDT